MFIYTAGFNEGVKYQKEQFEQNGIVFSKKHIDLIKMSYEKQVATMYTKEDLQKAFKAGQDYENFDCRYAFNEWFEKNKKK